MTFLPEIIGDVNNNNLTGTAAAEVMFGVGGNDLLEGLAGNDILVGGTGIDTMRGGTGDDIITWVNGDGSDFISGGEGRDQTIQEGSATLSDRFQLSGFGNIAFFERIALGGQLGVGRFTQTVDTTEVFTVVGLEGDDSLEVGNLAGTGVELVQFIGGLGHDTLNAAASDVAVEAAGGQGRDLLIGGSGKDTLRGGRGADVLIGGEGVDTLTGGRFRDQFVYRGNVFAGGTPVSTPAGINALNQPDILTDFETAEDQFVLDATDLGIPAIAFQKGTASGITGNGNVIVLTDGFANAAAAARAIADNNAITADAGVFVYFNTTLGISRLIYSADLGDGGNISALANLTNQAGAAGLANLTSFTAANFALT